MEDIHEMGLLMDFYGILLPPGQQTVMELYYGSDLTLSEIAEQSGITRQGAHDHLRKAKRSLREWEDKLKLVQRTVRLRRKLEEAMETLGGDGPVGERLLEAERILKELYGEYGGV